MQLTLSIRENDYLTKEEKWDIDTQISSIIQKHRGNTFEINRLVFDSITALTTSESRTYELAEQGMFKRFLGGLTGKNQRLQSEIDAGFARAQYSSQQTIQKLAEQNLMSFELITVVNNKLNSSIVEIETEINNIYSTLITFFKQSKSEIIQLENRVEKLERNINLLNWVNTIEYQMFNGVEYSELNDVEKIVCMVKDFYEITKGIWTTSDILLLKSALSQVGITPKYEILYIDFIKGISENENLMNILLKDDFIDNNVIEPEYVALLSALSKSKTLNNKEKFIVNSVEKQLKVNGIEPNLLNIKYNLINSYIEDVANTDLNKSVSFFDLIIEILFNFKQIYIAKVNNETQKMVSKAEEYYLDYNISRAYEIFLDLANKGNARAMYFLGEILAWGYGGIEVDKERSVYWKKLGYEKNDPLCSINYAYLIKNAWVEVNDEELKDNIFKSNFNDILAMAQNDDIFAQNEIADLYNGGYGIEKNENEAGYWIRKSAQVGFWKSQDKLGNMYYNGNEVEKDYEKAVKWYRKSAEKGYANAQDNLADMYYYGEGVSQDYEEAVRWYKRAAEQGYSVSQHTLAGMYYKGEGVECDKQKAYFWCKKSAEQGYSVAQNTLAAMYYYGEGVECDKQKAYSWYKKSADQGNEDAIKDLNSKF